MENKDKEYLVISSELNEIKKQINLDLIKENQLNYNLSDFFKKPEEQLVIKLNEKPSYVKNNNSNVNNIGTDIPMKFATNSQTVNKNNLVKVEDNKSKGIFGLFSKIKNEITNLFSHEKKEETNADLFISNVYETDSEKENKKEIRIKEELEILEKEKKEKKPKKILEIDLKSYFTKKNKENENVEKSLAEDKSQLKEKDIVNENNNSEINLGNEQEKANKEIQNIEEPKEDLKNINISKESFNKQISQQEILERRKRHLKTDSLEGIIDIDDLSYFDLKLLSEELDIEKEKIKNSKVGMDYSKKSF